MCAFCSLLSGGAPHWSETTTDAAQKDDARSTHDHHLDRARRAHVMNQVLAHYGCSIASWGSGQLILRSTRGKTVMVDALPQVWAVVEGMSHQPTDPLDKALLDRLEGSAQV